MDRYKALSDATQFCMTHGIEFPPDLIDGLESIGVNVKTQAYYESTLTRLVRTLYGGEIDELQFIQIMENLLEGQLNKAWMEGMAENELTEEDMTPEWQAMLDGIIADEKSHIGDFAHEIISASKLTGQPVDPYLARCSLWANRYEDTRNQAKMATSEPGDKMEWRLGATEQHCTTCASLNGIVATATEWQLSGFHPQSPPNFLLNCQGWKCDCSLEPTDKRHTRNALDKLMELALAAGHNA